MQFNVDQPAFPAARIVTDLAAQRPGDQLVAVADAKQRQRLFRPRPNPGGGALAPLQMIGNHSPRATENGAADRVEIGQRLAKMRANDNIILWLQRQRIDEPLRLLTNFFRHVRRRHLELN